MVFLVVLLLRVCLLPKLPKTLPGKVIQTLAPDHPMSSGLFRCDECSKRRAAVPKVTRRVQRRPKPTMYAAETLPGLKPGTAKFEGIMCFSTR